MNFPRQVNTWSNYKQSLCKLERLFGILNFLLLVGSLPISALLVIELAFYSSSHYVTAVTRTSKDTPMSERFWDLDVNTVERVFAKSVARSGCVCFAVM
jgi:hypothetical protein